MQNFPKRGNSEEEHKLMFDDAESQSMKVLQNPKETERDLSIYKKKSSPFNKPSLKVADETHCSIRQHQYASDKNAEIILSVV